MYSKENTSARAIGNRGETLAKHFLKEDGYHILEANVHRRLGEIDLIAQDPKTKEIVFVEVKTRKNNDFGTPEAFVNAKKIARIELAALLWLKSQSLDDQDLRIDVIAIENSANPPTLLHLKNVTQL